MFEEAGARLAPAHPKRVTNCKSPFPRGRRTATQVAGRHPGTRTKAGRQRVAGIRSHSPHTSPAVVQEPHRIDRYTPLFRTASHTASATSCQDTPVTGTNMLLNSDTPASHAGEPGNPAGESGSFIRMPPRFGCRLQKARQICWHVMPDIHRCRRPCLQPPSAARP